MSCNPPDEHDDDLDWDESEVETWSWTTVVGCPDLRLTLILYERERCSRKMNQQIERSIDRLSV